MNNKKKIWIFTIFPDYFTPFLNLGVSARAKEFFDIEVINLRNFSDNNYKSVDDSPYGGGPGMVIKADVCFRALSQTVLAPSGYDVNQWTAKTHQDPCVIDLSPRGITWDNNFAKKFSHELTTNGDIHNYVFFCGRYEGIDERFLSRFVHATYSIGDYVLSGAELAVQIILDSTFRFLPGVLGNTLSNKEESFETALLDAPCYTKPKVFFDMAVPEVLTSGHHAEIAKYQLEQRYFLTQKYRPDLLQKNYEE